MPVARLPTIPLATLGLCLAWVYPADATHPQQVDSWPGMFTATTARNTGDIWAVGGSWSAGGSFPSGDGAVMQHWDGKRWTSVSVP